MNAAVAAAFERKRLSINRSLAVTASGKEITIITTHITMALTHDDKRKALGKRLIEEINKPQPHLLRDRAREVFAKTSQSARKVIAEGSSSVRLTPKKMQEIADEVMPESWSRER